ncbi:MAG TPA: TetR/AcrR family transcriptional regulator [Aggregatilinea sp.]|jgi:AcrR family transcriptional regulator|uniref:TetR/AcrR family transcriptional regulator n=1 Tax=Aggregatilinea sp. TaxID=2806333 RepID=UPI002CD8D08E|nr:TetR/AcrR family transcriptional regulator [Aggregatilinea sp.]HML20704.1 TetR/AcrR family transcriptional regulator [Aggregatilinea sp.]
MNRYEQRKAATHQRLIAAARELIGAQGYENVDILDITERANLSKATFYQHFPNKEACVRALILQGFEALTQQIFDSERTTPNRWEWARDSFYKLFAWADENRRFVLIMVGGHASSELNSFGRAYMAQISQRIISERMPWFRELYAPELAAQFITGATIQMLGWWLEAETPYSANDMALLLTELFKRAFGMKSDGAEAGMEASLS